MGEDKQQEETGVNESRSAIKLGRDVVEERVERVGDPAERWGQKGGPVDDFL